MGASQVTSVVTYVGEGADSPRYDVKFRATLVAPYFLRLSDPLRVKEAVAIGAMEEGAMTENQLLEGLLEPPYSRLATVRSA